MSAPHLEKYVPVNGNGNGNGSQTTTTDKPSKLTIYINPELLKAVKHRAVDDHISLSKLAELAFEAYLQSPSPDQRR